MSPGFPCITPRGSGASPQSFLEQVGAFGVCEMIKPMAVVFVTLEFDATMDDGCEI